MRYLVALVCRAYIALLRQPSRVAPQILAEVTVVMTDSGQAAVYMSKVPADVNVNVVCQELLRALFQHWSYLGCTLHITTEEGLVVPLVRPTQRGSAP